MPRPGPRPYECVRRAWHSDRHQPIRGSLIQEIFRVVSEVHSSATKKNKEWQEKLPVVVLKAEEILYSKANSEAEYMDISTLWVRINEAISTIIRLDESTETGEYLHPCIEAALYLGCTPRRSSRTNQNSNLRCYLTSCTQQLKTTSPSTPDCTSQYFSFCRDFSNQTSNLTNVRSKCQSHSDAPNRISSDKKTSTECESVWPSVCKQQFSSCPLYPAVEKRKPSFQILPKSISTNLDVGELGLVKNLHSYDAIATKSSKEAKMGNSLQEQCKTACDLSLRLGPLSVPNRTIENSQSGTSEDIDASTSQGPVLIPIDRSLQLGRRFSFSLWGSAYGPLESRSREQSFRVDL